MTRTEDELCEIFAEGVKEIPAFATWVLSTTKFASYSESARLLHEEQMSLRPRRRWWRHWWCHVPTLQKDRETDIFMVFETPTEEISFRFALHIENKRDNYHFNEGQAEAYESRARHMLGKEEYLSYTDFCTILLSPATFRKRFPAKSALFDVFISYEEVATYLPAYDLKRQFPASTST